MVLALWNWWVGAVDLLQCMHPWPVDKSTFVWYLRYFNHILILLLVRYLDYIIIAYQFSIQHWYYWHMHCQGTFSNTRSSWYSAPSEIPYWNKGISRCLCSRGSRAGKSKKIEVKIYWTGITCWNSETFLFVCSYLQINVFLVYQVTLLSYGSFHAEFTTENQCYWCIGKCNIWGYWSTYSTRGWWLCLMWLWF